MISEENYQKAIASLKSDFIPLQEVNAMSDNKIQEEIAKADDRYQNQTSLFNESESLEKLTFWVRMARLRGIEID